MKRGWHQSEVQREAARQAHFKHGEADCRNADGSRSPASREYRSWKAMKDRCLNPNHRQHKDYADRGITICKRWLDSYGNFLADMGRCPDGLTLERLNNDGNYEPGNCSWATRSQQSTNQRHAWPQRTRNKKGQFQ